MRAVLVVMMMLAGCAEQQAEPPTSQRSASDVASPAPSVGDQGVEDMRSCKEAIGAEAAQRLVERCISISPATHPPCNVRNSCALIQSEIDRNCHPGDPTPSEACLSD